MSKDETEEQNNRESDLMTKRAYALAKDIRNEFAAIKSNRVPEGNNNVRYGEKTAKGNTSNENNGVFMKKNQQEYQ